MRTTKRYVNKNNGKVVIAVLFGGSSTDIACISRWMDVGGEYKPSQIKTCDFREFPFEDPEYGHQLAIGGDYIMYDGKGYFVVKKDYLNNCWEKVGE